MQGDRDTRISYPSLCRHHSDGGYTSHAGGIVTRKDFEFIARVIREMPEDFPRQRSAKEEYTRAFADALGFLNSRFNRERFIAACEGKEE